MFTVCPKCSLKLVVTAADLRAAQGYVRCGRCSDVFNALVGLSDEQQAVLAREERAAAGAAQAGAPQNAPPVPDARADERISDAALEFDPVATDVSEVFVEPQADEDSSTGRSETIILRTEDASVADASDGHAPAESASVEDTSDGHAPIESTSFGDTSDGRASAERAPPKAAPRDSALRESPAPADLQAPPLEPAQLELDSPDLEETDEFELADLEPLLDASAARSPSPADSIVEPHAGSIIEPRTDSTVEPHVDSIAEPHQALSDDSDVLDVEDVSSPAGGSQVSSELRVEASPHAPEAADVSDAAPVPERPHAPRGLPSSPDSASDPLSVGGPPPAARGIRRVLQLGSAALALLLAVQVAHHYRAPLAEIDWVRPPLTAIYAALGMPLAPHWDVTAYEVRQLGAVAGPENPGALTVRASIKNTAPRRQPLPLLRVTVQDRFGNRVGARDVPPRAYLPRSSAERLYLAAGQRVDAEIALADPGASVVGFEIDACLEDAAGRISCANDASGAR